MTNTMNTINIMDLIEEQKSRRSRSSRKGNFETYGSKKQLEEAEVLDSKTLELVKDIKGTFNFALHNSQKYLVITLYNKIEKYRFIVLDLDTLVATEHPSVKIAKQYVAELLAKEEVKEEKEEPKAEETEKKPKAKKTKATKEDKEETK